MTAVFNRVLLTVLGLALVAGGLLVIIEGIWSWTGNGFVWIPGHTWLSSFKSTAWSDPVTIAISVAVGAVGFVLFVVEAVPRRARVAPFPTENTGEWMLLRRSTEGHLQRRLSAQVPVSPIRARLNPKPRLWTLKIKARAAATTGPDLERAAAIRAAHPASPRGIPGPSRRFRRHRPDIMTPGRIDRRNRRLVAMIGLLVAAGGAASACVGAGVFGTARSDHAVFGPTLVRWWNEGGWKSFAVVVAIGVVAVTLGLWMALPQLRRNDARPRTGTIVFADSGTHRGETTLRAPGLSRGLENDLERLPDIRKAAVGLFGAYPDIELRAVVDVPDDADLEGLPDRVDEVLERVRTTTGVRLDPIRIAVRFTSANRDRQLQ